MQFATAAIVYAAKAVRIWISGASFSLTESAPAGNLKMRPIVVESGWKERTCIQCGGYRFDIIFLFIQVQLVVNL